MERIILKLSGQALSDNGTGISAKKIEAVVKEIKELASSDVQIGIVVGAGNMWRGRDAESNNMERSLADSIGMLGTVMNSLAVENGLRNASLKAITLSAVPMPSLVKSYTRTDAVEYLDKGYIVIFAGGTGNPYFSTDTAAALRASEIGAKKILMAKNGTDGVYDSDPRKNKNAIKFSKISHQELLERKLEVMDLTASTLCESNNIDIFVFDMNVKGNIKRSANDLTIGTLVTSK
jgi:uridylate kinase